MAQQTAVEWLKDKLKETYDKEGKLPLAYTLHLVEQAKQMEKEQIIRSYCDGFYRSGEGWNGEYGLKDIENIAEEINAEQYYNETFTLTPQGENPSATKTGQF